MAIVGLMVKIINYLASETPRKGVVSVTGTLRLLGVESEAEGTLPGACAPKGVRDQLGDFCTSQRW